MRASRGSRSKPHVHRAGEVAWAPTGLIFADVGSSRWSLPSSRALWIPGGLEHAAGASRDSVLLVLSMDPERWTAPWSDVTPMAVTPLLRELMLHLAESPPPDQRREHIEALVLGLLEPVMVPCTRLPMPTHPVAAQVAGAVLADLADSRTLGELGRLVGASSRTLARYFLAETGLTFGDWRAQARLRTAMSDLCAGASVSRVAGKIGYDTPSGFIAAFRRFAGCTPGRFQQEILRVSADDDGSVAA